MIDISYVLEKIKGILSKNIGNAVFIKDYNIKNKPKYPYGTVNIITPYIPQSLKPDINKKFDNVKDKIVYTREEEPLMTLSINVFSNDETECYNLCMNAISCLKFKCYDELSYNNIIVLEVSNIRNLTGMLIDNYEYRFQFDITVRVKSEIEKEVDYTKKITIKDENRDKNIIIKE